jgi:hypothetical protein
MSNPGIAELTSPEVYVMSPDELAVEDRTCPICWEEYSHDHPDANIAAHRLHEYPSQLVACGHVFGDVCLGAHTEGTWPNSNKCPLCRAWLFGSEEGEDDGGSGAEEETRLLLALSDIQMGAVQETGHIAVARAALQQLSDTVRAETNNAAQPLLDHVERALTALDEAMANFRREMEQLQADILADTDDDDEIEDEIEDELETDIELGIEVDELGDERELQGSSDVPSAGGELDENAIGAETDGQHMALQENGDKASTPVKGEGDDGQKV